jgi:murein DD-endopeptidase MepM/ murein hydrolase activator NlpD
VRRARIEREIAERHIEILKFQLKRLEEERKQMGPDLDQELNEEFRAGLRLIVDLIEGKRRADAKMVESFKEMWDANRAGLAAASLSDDDPIIDILWPVEPTYGISAIFKDPEYERYFGLEHNAIDIPALQGTPVTVAEDGVVEEVKDNGLGYSFITVRHAGYVTLYGHLSSLDVKKGQQLLKGDPLGETGGMPGTNGAGNLSTGPHLHFELITGVGHINPLKHLPAAGVELRS